MAHETKSDVTIENIDKETLAEECSKQGTHEEEVDNFVLSEVSSDESDSDSDSNELETKEESGEQLFTVPNSKISKRKDADTTLMWNALRSDDYETVEKLLNLHPDLG